MRDEAGKGYGQFCPVAKAAEIIAQRWSPLIARELCFGPKRFSEFQAALPLMARSLLAKRLQALEHAGIIETVANGTGHVYRFTSSGEALRPVIEAMSAWGQRWGQGHLGPDQLDPGALLWAIKRQIAPDALPDQEQVIRFDFRGLPKPVSTMRYWWLVLQPDDVDVCQRDPGKAVQVVVTTDLATFIRVWMGQEGLDAAIASGKTVLSGAPRATARLCRILKLRAEPWSKPFSFHDPRAGAAIAKAAIPAAQ